MKPTIKCRECGSDMYLDDTDYNFKGNYDRYYNCPNCRTSCIEETRYGKPIRQYWHSENPIEGYDHRVLDYEVKL